VAVGGRGLIDQEFGRIDESLERGRERVSDVDLRTDAAAVAARSLDREHDLMLRCRASRYGGIDEIG